MNTNKQRCGFSLLELLAVVTLLGVFSSVAVMRFGRDIFGDAGSRSQARIVSLALLQAQRAAIRTGDRHAMFTNGLASGVTSWTIVQERADKSTVIVDGPHSVPEDVKMSVNHSEMWFDFEGNGSQLFQVMLVGPNRTYETCVEPLTRMIRTEEVKR